MKELKFWKGLALASGLLSIPQLLWAPARTGGIFFLLLAIGCGGEFLMLFYRDRHPLCKLVSRIGRVLFVLFVLSFVAVQYLIVAGMQKDAAADHADAVLVLGARVYESGKPSATLIERMDVAANFLETHPDAIAVLCGGQGSNEPFPEAEAMRRYLSARGISESRLLMDDLSSNTIQNIRNAKVLLDARFPGTYQTAVISSDFHLARARRLMRHAELDTAAIPAKTPYLLQRLSLHLREYGSIMGLMLSGRW